MKGGIGGGGWRQPEAGRNGVSAVDQSFASKPSLALLPLGLRGCAMEFP
jgi:hypothetical protein